MNKRQKLLFRLSVIGLMLLSGIFIAKSMSAEGINKYEEEVRLKREKKTKKKLAKEIQLEPTEEAGQEKADEAEEKPPEKAEDLYQLVKNSNHYKIAEDYAYDVAKISAHIRNSQDPERIPYEGTEKIVFLTFDDGPNHQVTPRILDILKEKEVHATFFQVGTAVSEETKDVIERQLKEGHAIALHSWTHDYDLLYPGRVANSQRILQEVRDQQQAFQDLLGPDFHSRVFRYPGGHMSWQSMSEIDNLLKKEDVYWIDWNSLNGDGEPKSRRPTTAQGLADYTFETMKYFVENNIVVVLMHDAANKDLTVESLPMIIDGFKERGYKFGILK